MEYESDTKFTVCLFVFFFFCSVTVVSAGTLPINPPPPLANSLSVEFLAPYEGIMHFANALLHLLVLKDNCHSAFRTTVTVPL